jgi:hypothetical protein
MTRIIVTSQKEFDDALRAEADEIEIRGDFSGIIKYSPYLYVAANSQPHVEAWENSQPHVEARGNIMLRLTGKISAIATDTCMVYLHNGAVCKGGLQSIAKVKVSEIVVHENAEYPTKVKAPRVYKPCYEVDRYGNPIEAKK